MIFDIKTRRQVTDPPMYGPVDNAGTDIASRVLDTQGSRGANVFVIGGAWTGTGTMAATLEESDTLEDVDFTAVDASDYVGGAAPAAFSAANQVHKIGYIGNKRYIRAKLAKTGTVSAFLVAIIGELEYSELQPNDDPSPVIATS